MLPRSLTARLTLLIALGAAVVVGICLLALYVALVGQLRSALDSGLLERSEDLEASVQSAGDDMLARDPLAQLYPPTEGSSLDRRPWATSGCWLPGRFGRFGRFGR